MAQNTQKNAPRMRDVFDLVLSENILSRSWLFAPFYRAISGLPLLSYVLGVRKRVSPPFWSYPRECDGAVATPAVPSMGGRGL